MLCTYANKKAIKLNHRRDLHQCKNPTMHLVLIISIALISGSGLVQSSQQCSFPGIPFNGSALNEQDQLVTWEERPYFPQWQRVRFYCGDQPDPAGEIQCVKDASENGVWNGPLPVCEKDSSVFCGWPPVPVNAEVISQVSYRCRLSSNVTTRSDYTETKPSTAMYQLANGVRCRNALVQFRSCGLL